MVFFVASRIPKETTATIATGPKLAPISPPKLIKREGKTCVGVCSWIQTHVFGSAISNVL